MSIPNNITEEHIYKALKEIDQSKIPISRESNRYFLRHNRRNYPPKYVVSIANRFANDFELDPSSFNTYQAQDLLRSLRFSVIDNKEANPSTYNGFKLVSLDLRNNLLLGTIYYDFIEENDSQTSIYTSVLIGPNGTGKSNLFRVVIELLKELYQLSKGEKKSSQVDGQFSLKYSFNNKLYDFTNFRNFEKTGNTSFSNKVFYRYLLIDGINSNYSLAEFPDSIVANSIMLTDKYPISSGSDEENVFPFYHYLGVRNRPQQASTRSYVRKTVEFIVSNISSDVFAEGIKSIAYFLTNSSSIEILFFTSNTNKFFKGNLVPDDLYEYFGSIAEKYKESDKIPPFKLNHFNQISSDRDLLQDICDFCNKLYYSNRLKDISKSSIKFLSYDITIRSDHSLLKEEFLLLEQLRQLGMLSAAEINLGNKSKYNLQESSSGEYHFFSSMVGLMATVKPNSLIFIDEPEISLHPNWQMQYLTFLRNLFSKHSYSTSHIVLATHSHFIISDLQGENSKIIGLKRENDIIETVEFPTNLNTFGWSAEDVLYNIFNVKSTWNSFLEADLTELLGRISNNDRNRQRISEIIEKLDKLPKRPNDPLQQIISEAKEYLEIIR